jgi:hypothetical protein
MIVGDEDPVPPMNASPHPYSLPYMSVMQQHQLDLQVWNQQNADIPWEIAANAANAAQAPQDNGEWGDWPYEGISLRALTGYEGLSMLDGVVPEGNISDDPDTWSPLIEIEDAAENVLNGRSEGSLVFVRAGGQNQELEVDSLTESYSVFEHGESSRSVQSVIVVPEPLSFSTDPVLEFISWNPRAFAALIRFLNDAIYHQVPLLPVVPCVMEPSDLSVEYVANASTKFFALLKDNLLLSCVTAKSTLISAAKLSIREAISPPKEIWDEDFRYMSLNEEGVLVFAPTSEVEWADISMSSNGPANQDSWAGSSEGEVSSSMTVSVRKRGRPRKNSSTATTSEAPLVKSMVRYYTRLNNAGFKEQMLDYTRKPKAKASKAIPPAVLQIEEMQRIGIEECNIDPAELSVEQLMKP